MVDFYKNVGIDTFCPFFVQCLCLFCYHDIVDTFLSPFFVSLIFVTLFIDTCMIVTLLSRIQKFYFRQCRVNFSVLPRPFEPPQIYLITFSIKIFEIFTKILSLLRRCDGNSSHDLSDFESLNSSKLHSEQKIKFSQSSNFAYKR